jgi:hypothetical protein
MGRSDGGALHALVSSSTVLTGGGNQDTVEVHKVRSTGSAGKSQPGVELKAWLLPRVTS